MNKSPLLSLPGAVPAEGPDEGVAAHYGDLFREQRALADGTGFVDLSHRGVVTVSGADRLSWLHLLLTQHVEQLPPHQATEALILSAHGHIEHALYLVDDGTTTWMHVEPGSQEALIAYLESMKFFYRVDVADAADQYAVVYLPAGSIAQVPTEWAVRETPYGRDVFVPRDKLEGFTATAGPPAGVLAHEALRIEAHRPRVGLETDHRTIPHELGWLESAVHLQKGATGARRPSPACTTWGGRRAASSSSTSTAARCGCRPTALPCASPSKAPTPPRAARSASSPLPPGTGSWAPSPSPWSSGTPRSTRR